MTSLELIRGRLVVAAMACLGLASCDQVQEAVEQAKTEAAKLQAQAETEAKKLQDQATSATGGSESAPGADPLPVESAETAKSPSGGLAPALAPASPAPAVDGAQLVKHFLELPHIERKDSHLLELAGLDENHRNAIETMELQGSQVTSQGLATLPKFPSLKRLNLGHKDLMATDMAVIGQLAALEELNLEHAQVDDQELAGLSPLVGLKSLNLTRTQVTDAGLSALREMTALEKLILSETSVTGAEVGKLKCLPHLTHLGVATTNFGNGGEKVLRQLDRIEVLHASACGLNDALVGQIKGRRTLRELDLANNLLVTDRSAGQLSGCAALEHLSLAHNPVTDATLKAYQRMKSLKRLNVYKTSCSLTGVTALQKALPGLEVQL
jgi:Leucine-rich repeat (LRR) protein